MSEQVDTRALRAKAARRVEILLRAADPVASVEAHISRTLRDELVTIERDLSDAATALLDEVDALRAERDELHASASRLIDEIKRLTYSVRDERAERDALRARVAELEREVERVREAAHSAASSLRAIAAPQGTTWGVRDDAIRSYAMDRANDVFAALAPRAEVKP